MTKIRKVKKRQRYNHNVNRKRLAKPKLPSIRSKAVKEAWDKKKSTQSNLKEMGLVHDINKAIKSGCSDEQVKSSRKAKRRKKNHQVVKALEEDANAPRERNYKLPKGEVEFLTYLLDKYGDNYKAMVLDRKNYLQHTWKQLRSKINVFKKIPEQYEEYLRQKA